MAKAILLAEDFEDDAVFLQRVLKKAGVVNPVMVVGDGDKAIAYLRGDGVFSDREKFPIPGVLFLDLKMPGKNGFEVLEWLKDQSQLKELLVVVLSGYHEVRDVNRAYALGAHTFLVKPCNQEDFANLMKAFAGHWIHSSPP
jgi:CheY-like chemotaxis protein